MNIDTVRPDYVDMGTVTIGGVEKNLKWATCNVGATNPWDYGDYLAWGETEPKSDYSWSTYKFELGTNMQGPFSKYVNDDSYGTVDNKTTLDPEDDAAHVKWGGTWRIPTYEEWTSLCNETHYDWTWTDDYLSDGSNHAGQIVTRKNVGGNDPCAGNSIFLPATGRMDGAHNESKNQAGYYWSSFLSDERTHDAHYITFISGLVSDYNYFYRFFGLSVRPVTE